MGDSVNEKIVIKVIENGWQIKYDEYRRVDTFTSRWGEYEKAFTYDFANEKKKTWDKLIQLIEKQLY